jgi:hypothetical protein
MLTKYTETELRAELNKQIAALLARREDVHPVWLTHTVCGLHKSGLAKYAENTVEPEDVAFWRFCGYTHTRKLATACINDLDTADETNDADDAGQPFFPGMNFIQPQYVIRRDGVDVMVPTEKITPEELRAKAAQFERTADTTAEHARELRRYAAIREEELTQQAKTKAATV